MMLSSARGAALLPRRTLRIGLAGFALAFSLLFLGIGRELQLNGTAQTRMQSIHASMEGLATRYSPGSRLMDADKAAAPIALVLADMHTVNDDKTPLLSDAEVRRLNDGNPPVPRFEVQLKIQGTFPAISAWIGGLLDRHPLLALQSIEIQRETATSALVNGRAVFTYFGPQ